MPCCRACTRNGVVIGMIGLGMTSDTPPSSVSGASPSRFSTSYPASAASSPSIFGFWSLMITRQPLRHSSLAAPMPLLAMPTMSAVFCLSMSEYPLKNLWGRQGRPPKTVWIVAGCAYRR